MPRRFSVGKTGENVNQILKNCENIVNEANKKWNIKTVDTAPTTREANTIYFVKIR